MLVFALAFRCAGPLACAFFERVSFAAVSLPFVSESFRGRNRLLLNLLTQTRVRAGSLCSRTRMDATAGERRGAQRGQQEGSGRSGCGVG